MWLLMKFSEIFEKQFNKVIGLKLDTYLLSVFLSIGVATFALSGKGFERTSEANLTNLIDNLSVPAAFFEFKGFNISFTSSEVTRIL